nr:hypothetical protein [Clostridioides difficile]
MYKNNISIDFDKINKKIENLELTISEGRVKKIIGLTVEVEGIKAFVGELCVIYNQVNKPVNCEVVGFKDKKSY